MAPAVLSIIHGLFTSDKHLSGLLASLGDTCQISLKELNKDVVMKEMITLGGLT